MNTIKHFSEFSSSLDLNESIEHGFYYFPKLDVDSSMQPAKGETKFAVIAHNTIKFGRSTMYLKSNASRGGLMFEAKIISVHDTEEEAKEEYKKAMVLDNGSSNLVSYAYGKLTVKGSNLPFEEIDGTRREIK